MVKSYWSILFSLLLLTAFCNAVIAQNLQTPACDVSLNTCSIKKHDNYALCQPNALLEFYTPGLPTEGDRATIPIDFSAQKVQSADKDQYVMEGNVKAQRLDELLQANKIIYNNATTAYQADGNVRYQDRGLLISAQSARGTATPETTYLTDLHYQLLMLRGNGVASDATLSNPNHALLHDITYSTCDPKDRVWEIRAREMELNREENRGIARDAVLSYRETPFFYLPYFSFPLSDERKSGFLYPKFGYDGQRGFDFTLPYYLNLAPNYDATLYPRLMSKRGLMMGGEFRYLTPRNRGEVEFTYLPHDADAKRDRGSFRYRDWSIFSANWGAIIDINHVSDNHYFRDFSDTLTTTATSLLPSSAYVNGRGDGWAASIGADAWQITDPDLPDVFEPYRRLPRAVFEGKNNLSGRLDAGVKAEYVHFHKDDPTNALPVWNGQRLDIYPYLAYPLEGGAYFLRPELGWRYTSYDINRHFNPAAPDNALSMALDRSVPIFSLDAGLFFERSLNLGNQAYTQTLEPRIYYLRVPYRNQNDLPIFDTQEPTFDFGHLFRTNRFVGADRQMDANNLTLALQSRLLEDATGQERLTASIGQIRYFDQQQVQLPGRNSTEFEGSSYVGEIDWRLNDRWRLRLADQWNPNTQHTDFSSIAVQHRFGEEGIFNLAYRFRRDVNHHPWFEEVDSSILYPVSERWRIVARSLYSLKEKNDLETLAGAEYDSCCLAFRVLGRRYVHDTAGKSSNGIYFEVEFKGLGAFGQKTESFLRRAIVGYK